MTLASVALSCMAAPPVLAFRFTRVSDGSGHRLTWFWEGCTNSCLVFPPCGDQWSVDGRIPLSGSSNGLAAGMLDWTGTSDSLRIVALTAVRSAVGTTDGCQGAWAAVNALTDPMVGTSEMAFVVQADPGDPFPLSVDLQIRPRLLGTVVVNSDPGAVANLWLQMQMSVAVDGQVVSTDVLSEYSQLSDGADVTRSLAFPKGAANTVVARGVTAGTQVSVALFAYMRAHVSGRGSVEASSPHGSGPAIEVLARPASAVTVLPEDRPERLWMEARPNPSPGATRVLYALPRTSRVRLSLYDVAGSRVVTLLDRIEDAGRGAVTWDGRDSRGRRLPSGVYLAELLAGTERIVGKVVMLAH